MLEVTSINIFRFILRGGGGDIKGQILQICIKLAIYFVAALATMTESGEERKDGGELAREISTRATGKTHHGASLFPCLGIHLFSSLDVSGAMRKTRKRDCRGDRRKSAATRGSWPEKVVSRQLRA